MGDFLTPTHHQFLQDWFLKMKVSKYIVIVDQLVDRLMQSCLILFSTRTSISLIIREDVWAHVLAKEWDAINSRDLSALIDAEVLVPNEENELDFILAQNNAATQDDETLYFVVQPTQNCQLGCFYCGQEHNTTRLLRTTTSTNWEHPAIRTFIGPALHNVIKMS